MRIKNKGDLRRVMIEGNDIPIGSDQYWQIVTGEVRRGESGPKVFHTR